MEKFKNLNEEIIRIQKLMGLNEQSVNGEETKITGNDFNELRDNMKKLGTLSISKNDIDLNFHIKPMEITLPKGNDSYKSFSFIFDPNNESLQNRFETNIKKTNPNVENLLNGSWGTMHWMILGFK